MVMKKGGLLVVTLFLASASLSLARPDMEELDQCLDRCHIRQGGQEMVMQCMANCAHQYYIQHQQDINPMSPSKEYEKCQRQCEGCGQKQTQKCIERCDDEEDLQCQKMCKMQGQKRKMECQQGCDIKFPPLNTMSPHKEQERCERQCEGHGQRKTQWCIEHCDDEEDEQCQQMCKEQGERTKMECQQGCDTVNPSSIMSHGKEQEKCQRHCEGRGQRKTERCIERCDNKEDPQCQQMCKEQGERMKMECQEQEGCDMKMPQLNPCTTMSHGKEYEKCQQQCLGVRHMKTQRCMQSCEKDTECQQMCKELDEMMKTECQESCDMNTMEGEVEEEFLKCEQMCQRDEKGYQQKMQCQKRCEQERDQSLSQSKRQSRMERFKKCRSDCSGLGILQQVPCKTRCAAEFGIQGMTQPLESILDIVV